MLVLFSPVLWLRTSRSMETWRVGILCWQMESISVLCMCKVFNLLLIYDCLHSDCMT